MDFNLPEELQVLKETVRKFVDRELIPLERECRPEGEDMNEEPLCLPNRLGADNDPILSELLGYDQATIDQWRREEILT